MMKALVNNSNWLLIVIVIAVGFFYIRTVTSDGAFQFGEIAGLIAITASIIFMWFVVRTERWQELKERYKINRILIILFILALIILLVIFYVYFWSV